VNKISFSKSRKIVVSFLNSCEKRNCHISIFYFSVLFVENEILKNNNKTKKKLSLKKSMKQEDTKSRKLKSGKEKHTKEKRKGKKYVIQFKKKPLLNY
jgi:hypothetical protein